ncbi:MFS transporter [Rhodococcus sp. DMU1]|uniref:MFS transporter n=1 Tax=Rhodococcus sp. DMU1 TaxID=2722825 RepID=UPI00143EBE73|nr:MFS transporter [Rhodococcus sp. DMU1]QIX53713.1 MFS transporter [Rhodococcus sp. DMU1]
MKQPDDQSMDPGQRDTVHRSITARLEKLPARGRSRMVIAVAALAIFFDIGDGASLGLVAPTLREAIGLSTGMFALTMSATFIGSFLGASIGGLLSDRYGRVRIFRLALAVTTLFTLAQSLISSPIELILLRFMAGTGIGSLFVVAIIYLVEMSPPSRRTARTAIVSGIGVAGSAVFATLARLIIPIGPDGWRFVFCISALAILLYIPLRLLPESPLWLVTQGRLDDAESAMVSMERNSGVSRTLVKADSADESAASLVGSPTVEDVSAEPDTVQAGAGEPVRLTRGPLLVSLVLVSVMLMLYSTAGQSFSMWLPTILDTRGFDSSLALTVTAVSLYGAPIGAGIVYLSSRFISRWAMMFTLAAMACISIVIFFASNETAVVIAAAFVVMAVSGAYSPLTNVTASEEFPTAVRASGMGFAHSTTRVSNAIAPFWLALVLNSGLFVLGSFLTGLWLGILAVVAALRTRHVAAQRRDSRTQAEEADQPLVSSQQHLG